MPTSSNKDFPKLISLGVLHMAQYFPITFTGIALPFLFRQEGLPLEMFWLLALPALPRWLKWAIALVVDNYGSERIGRRRSWIIPCTVVATGTYALLAFIPPSLDNVLLITGILVACGFVMAAQDIAVDAYAAESMTDAERPTGTSIINFLAGLAGVLGIVAVTLVERYSWTTTMLAAAALLLFAALPALLRPEPPTPAARQVREARGERPSLIGALKRRESFYILLFMFLFGFGHQFFLSMIGPFWADHGVSIETFGIIAATGTIAGGMLAAVTTPRLVERYGMRVSATVGLLVLPFEAGVYMYFDQTQQLPGLIVILPTVALLSFSTAIFLYTATISRFRWVSKAQAGTDYSLQSSMWNLGLWAAGSLSGLVAGSFGYSVFFPVAAVVTLCGGLFYVIFWQRIENLVREREIAEQQ
ncbi:MAG: MFS transporter [Pseudomonadales bacterium]